MRAIVVAIGPGHYPNVYRDKEGNKNPPKGKRATVEAGMIFVPTEVRVGDIVHLDGRQTGKSAFDSFYWGTRYCLHARQEDCAGVEVA